MRTAEVDADPHRTWRAVCRVGGARGWYSGAWLWRIRGWMDRVAGGPGLRKVRRDPERLRVGDPLDFWRVEDVERDERVVLHAEMRLPGEAWLEWDLTPTATGTHLEQTARYRPRGLWGRAYWYAVAPFHRFIFPGLLRGIARDAAALSVVEATGAAPNGSVRRDGRRARR